ncbi:alanyl-tRNA editing protein [Candidatus Woesearchaeota archaeon]|nr:alanyl-tRNA editing protein [Candidatus Woesearchaeota archaeon]
MSTKKLFRENPYLTHCTANVVSVNGNDILLDQTVFFAFAGGQASDQGTIGGKKVVAAVLSEDQKDIIYILEEGHGLKVGDKVEVAIDPIRREKIRCLHSGVHVVMLLFQHKTGITNYIGSNVAADKGRFDFCMEKSCAELLPELEKESNAIIDRNLAVFRGPSKENPDRWEWQALDEQGNNIDYLFCPCGGLRGYSHRAI